MRLRSRGRPTSTMNSWSAWLASPASLPRFSWWDSPTKLLRCPSAHPTALAEIDAAVCEALPCRSAVVFGCWPCSPSHRPIRSGPVELLHPAKAARLPPVFLVGIRRAVVKPRRLLQHGGLHLQGINGKPSVQFLDGLEGSLPVTRPGRQIACDTQNNVLPARFRFVRGVLY